MSLKDLFEDKGKSKLTSQQDLERLGQEVESSGNLQQRLEEKNRFIPIIDFDYPENFARYGKAEKYYEDSINRILDFYPYDGSLREKTKFRNESSYLDLYILENKHPRTTGHAIFSPNGWGSVAFTAPNGIALSDTPEYVNVKGGPNQAPDQFLSKPISKQFPESNKYDSNNNRENNLKFDFNQGVTVEFWLKKDDFISGTAYEFPFMLSNEDSGSLSISFRTILSASSDNSIYARWTSGSVNASIQYTDIANSDFIGDWHHFAFTFQNSGSNVVSKVYLDGDLKGSETSISTAINDVPGALKANIGAARKSDYPLSALHNIPADGYGKLSGSIDEFRYWKTVRNSKEIGRHWFTEVGGGTNNDLANVDLGVYFKFNEGITGDSSIDSKVLDYSGRISNGTWTGYASNSRDTSSAIDTYFNKETEFKDPIIYATHPDVVLTKSSLISSGSEYDFQNNASIFNSFPSWVTEEDEESDSELLNLSQIMASYFDTLHLQIQSLPRIKDPTYNDPSEIKPLSFSDRLLESQGFIAPEIFADADVLSQILKRDDDRKYELDLYDIKNVIYQNIYNNLISIYKSKGTEKSFRNLIRCFGVDEQLIKINVYGNNSEYEFRDNFRSTSVKKKYADFNHPDRFAATVYQQTASANPNSVSYISGSSLALYNPLTVEAEVVFPKKLERSSREYFDTPFVSSSLFGFHAASSTSTDYTWSSPDTDLKVFSVKDQENSPDVRFILEASQLGVSLETDTFSDVYDNEKWNISVRISPKNVGVDLVSGSSGGGYLLEFSGYNSDAGIIQNQFYLTSSVSNIQNYTTSSKRLYLGAHRTNFTGSVLQSSDVKISSLRYWASHLSDETLKSHARDPSSYGVDNPYESTFLYETSLDGIRVPKIETLALNWDFDNVSSSDGGVSGIPTVSDAGYLVQDVSSGSSELLDRYGWFGGVVKPQHTGRGDFYLPDDTKVVDTKFIYGGIKTNPEISQASDMVSSIGETDLYFSRETRPLNYYYSIEKSMYQTISDEMLKMFATIVDFNNLVGNPVNKYRQKYKPMEKLRNLFFERVENTPDLDKYIEFYKWIDYSLGIMLQQLVPLSADVSDGIRTVIESHVLERNKYQYKFPTLELKQEDPLYGIKGINESLINWRFFHHPINDEEDTNCNYWYSKADPSEPPLSSSAPGVNSSRAAIFQAKRSVLNRSFSTPYRFGASLSPKLKGGNNVRAPKSLDIARSQIRLGTTDGIEFVSQQQFKDCTDEVLPNEKRKIIAFAESTQGNTYLETEFNKIFPYTLFSSSVSTGYQQSLTYALENLHRDTYGYDSETPMQGPFTEKHVGGLQFRHIPLNTGSDNASNRAEGWELSVTPALKITSIDFGRPRTNFYRDEVAKRPVNIRNIKGNYGNYTKDYQIVQTNSRYINNKAWVSASGWQVLSPTYWVTGSGLTTQAKIQRGRTEHVFVNRFSAPGGPETMGDSDGGAGLDRYSAEFSPNNDMNARNITVRKDLQNILSSHVNQFGYYSGENVPGAISSSVDELDYSGTASLYKINRNGSTRLEYSGSQVVTSSFYDNFYVQHAIPKPERDFDYNWSGSLESDFVSFTSSVKFGKTSGSAGSTYYLPTVYNGLNYNVYEPISPNSAFLGLEDSASIQYLNETLIADGFQDTLSSASMLNAILLKRQGPYGYSTWKQIRTGEHPLARYYRNNNLLRVTNLFADVTEVGGQQYVPKYGETINFKEPVIDSNFGKVEHTFGLRVEALAPDGDREYVIRPVTIKSTYGNDISYFYNEKLNQLADYDKNFVSTQEQAYDVLKGYYLDGALNSVSSPIYSLVKLKYSERVYPSAINCYTFKNRAREGYQETFWRDNRSQRTTLGELKFNGSSSQGVSREQSAWAMDAAEQFENPLVLDGTNTITEISSGLGVCSSPSYMYETCSSGELLNDYMLCWQRWQSGPNNVLPDPARDSTTIRAGAMYARPSDINSIWSVVSIAGSEFINTALANNTLRDTYLNPFERAEIASTINPGGPGFEDGDVLGYINSTTGRARFEAHEQAGYIENGQFVSASTTPFYDSYGDYVLEPRLKNKDYSVIPEFRMSEEMEFYFNQKGQDFLSENPEFLKIPGTNEVSSTSEFYKDYSYSDFMKFFEVIDNDHKDLGLEKTLTLKCKAIKKFIPYDGFFPAERTLQIASEFSSSYYKSLDLRESGDARERPFLKPFMAPGILYNTIKSGIAVDYPIFTGSFSVVNYVQYVDQSNFLTSSYYALGTGSRGTDGWDYRVPFEALIDPETLGGIKVFDSEPNPQIDVDGNYDKYAILYETDKSKDNLYKRSMSNFLAGVREFFLADLTTFRSTTRPSDYQFSVEPNSTYGMRIRMRRSMKIPSVSSKNDSGANADYYAFPQDDPTPLGASGDVNFETITMYSRPSAFGPPVAGAPFFRTTSSYGYTINGDQRYYSTRDSLTGVNSSFTPPYYDGQCWYDIVFENTESTSRQVTLKEILEESRVNEIRVDPSGSWEIAITMSGTPYGSGEYPMSRSCANNFAMKLSSCINPFILKTLNPTSNRPSTEEQWVIETKMETPVLNFSDQTLRPLNLSNITLPTNAQSTSPFQGGTEPACQDATLNGYGGQIATSIGMWHQFGLIPQGDEGIYLSIGDIDSAFLERAGSTRNIDTTFYTNSDDMKSLSDLVGFAKSEKKIGRLKNFNTVFEAVIAIPYEIIDGERRLFKISRTEINNAQFVLEADPNINVESALSRLGGVPGDSIIDMVRKMQKYILPPRFDFVKNEDVTPFAMYIFEFSHTFDQNDLSYIWQNLTPRGGKKFEEASAAISHKILGGEILEDFEDRVKFMVFKVKQRGNNNYYSILEGQPQEKSQQYDYSYNWPYDYFSLVEFAKVESEIEYSSEQPVDVNKSNSIISQVLDGGLRATKQLPPTIDRDRAYSRDLTQKEIKDSEIEDNKDDKERRKDTGAFKENR